MNLVMLAVVPPFEREVIFSSAGFYVDASAKMKVIGFGVVVLGKIGAALGSRFGGDSNSDLGIVSELVFEKREEIRELVVHIGLLRCSTIFRISAP
jgi:hypothetical protein